MKPTILFDLDGVIVDFLKGIDAELLQKGFRMFDNKEYDLAKKYKPTQLNMTWELKDAIIYTVSSVAFWENLQPYPGALNAIKIIAKYCDVKIISAPWRKIPGNPMPREASITGKTRWLETNLPGIEYHLDHKKWQYQGDIFVEDHPEALHNWADKWGGKVIIFDHKYNRSFKAKYRVKTWKDISEFVFNNSEWCICCLITNEIEKFIIKHLGTFNVRHPNTIEHICNMLLADPCMYNRMEVMRTLSRKDGTVDIIRPWVVEAMNALGF